MLPSETEAGLGAIDIAEIAQENELVRRKRRQVYNKWSDEDRYKVGKYALENGAAAAVRKFKGTFKNLKRKYCAWLQETVETELKNAKKEKRNAPKKLPLVKQGRPVLLGDVDSMVQKYILAATTMFNIYWDNAQYQQ